MRIFIRIVLALVVLGGVLFGSAGRFDLPFLWGFLAVYAVGMALAVVLMPSDLIKERMRPGAGGTDRALRFTIIPFFAAHLIIAGLDVGRFGWSTPMPTWLQVVGLAGLAAGFALSLAGVRVNRFFSPVVRIQSERGHHVVTDGPYRWIRHPGYTSTFVMLVASGMALGSWWSLLPLAPVAVMILRRTIIEDRFLHEHLPGYAEYASRVRWRLLPGVW
jgi:protein-S-isoprenylcysteine O-methyltransferase Ste14